MPVFPALAVRTRTPPASSKLPQLPPDLRESLSITLTTPPAYHLCLSFHSVFRIILPCLHPYTMCCLIFHTFWTLSSIIVYPALTIRLYHSVTVFLRLTLFVAFAAVHFRCSSESHGMNQSVFSHFKADKYAQPPSCGRAAVSVSVSRARVQASLQGTGLITRLRRRRQGLRRGTQCPPPEVQVGHHGTASPTTECVPWNLVVVFIFISQSISGVYHVFVCFMTLIHFRDSLYKGPVHFHLDFFLSVVTWSSLLCWILILHQFCCCKYLLLHCGF